MSPEKMIELKQQCTKFLHGNYPQYDLPHYVLHEIAEMAGPDMEPDIYGEGEVIHSFETEVAQLLGKEAAVFMPSGTMAQQIALRIWSDRKGSRSVAFHPKCHLEIHEQKGYQMLHGLHALLVGSPDRLITLDDLQHVAEPLAALLLELPQREIGGQLPSWEELVAQVDWAHQRGLAVHMDGARLWESQPYYGRSYAEIAGLFDSVYVSVYKGLGGITGSLLAGPQDFIAEARIWQRRHGGNLVHLYPFVLSARKGLESELEWMGAYHEKALEVSAALASVPGIEVVPNPPQTNMMHVYLRGDREKLERAAEELAVECKIFLFYRLSPSPFPAYQKFELTLRRPSLEFSGEEVKGLFQTLMEKANR